MDLDRIMEIDHVIRVHADGTVSDADDSPRIYAPECLIETDQDGQILAGHEAAFKASVKSQGWDLMDGYSGQYRYAGPIMHPSEYIGGGLARDILERPGLYVACIVSCLPYGSEDNSETGETEDAGWIVCRRTEDNGS
jgi:hypothetical protein